MLLQDYSQQPRHAHPNCPLPEEWAKKNVYIDIAKYYSNIKKNEIQLSVTDNTYGCSSHCVKVNTAGTKGQIPQPTCVWKLTRERTKGV